MSSSPPSVTLLSRRLLRQYERELRQAHPAVPQKKATVNDDKPWPRNVVYGAYATMALVIPYTAAWFLSSNAPLREMLLPDDDSSWLLEWMRHHFGVPDRHCLSEPETLVVHSLPHRFVDEPTARLRHQQTWLQQFLQGSVRVQMTGRDGASAVVQLPAHTRPADLAAPVGIPLSPPWALDFLDDEAAASETAPNDSAAVSSAAPPDGTPTVPILSIYSLWQYQAPLTSSDASVNKLSPLAIERSRLDYEIQRLQEELQQASRSHRSIDELQAELAAVQRARRRLQWRALWSGWW